MAPVRGASTRSKKIVSRRARNCHPIVFHRSSHETCNRSGTCSFCWYWLSVVWASTARSTGDHGRCHGGRDGEWIHADRLSSGATVQFEPISHSFLGGSL